MRSFSDPRKQVLKLTVVASLAILTMLLGVSVASADTLVIGTDTNWISFDYTGGLNGTYGGGSFDTATLNGEELPWIYCVDLNHYIHLGGIYGNAEVTNDGIVNGSLVTNAGQVAWLLNEYADSSNVNEAALQAAIWETIYGDSFALRSSNSTAMLTAYNGYINALQNALSAGSVDDSLVGNFAWITPNPTNDDIQGQITRVPEPSIILLLGVGIGLISLITLFRRS